MLLGTNFAYYSQIDCRSVSVCFGVFCLKVYVKHLLEPLLHTILALPGPRTTIMVLTFLLNHDIFLMVNLDSYFVLDLFVTLIQ